MQGNYRFPTICGDSVAFICEDDLWSVSANGGRATRLTAGISDCSSPFFSPDGSTIAFTAKYEGTQEIYYMNANGGTTQQLTFLGAKTQTVGWMPDGTGIILSTNARQPFLKIRKLYTISPSGGEIVELPYGIANNIAFGSGGAVLIGRNTADPAAWKRYRGGTAGVLWIDRNGTGEFVRACEDLRGNIACPMWVGERIYFISDHEGIGNIYSCLANGDDMRRETSQKEFFARNASTDGNRIIYHAGGDIFILDPTASKEHKLEIEFAGQRPQTQRRFVDTAEFLEDCSIHPKGHYLSVTARGKTFTMGNWEGPTQQIGAADSARYRLTQWLPDGERCLVISDEGGEECIEIYKALTGERIAHFDGLDIGRTIDIVINPKQPVVTLANNRLEMFLFNYETGELNMLARSEHHDIGGMAWSPDGEWLAYSFSSTSQTFSLRIYSMADNIHRDVTEPSFRDMQPCFDPGGKYLYFLSYREFNPVYDTIFFDLNFPRGIKPYLITLQSGTPSPFVAQPKPIESDNNSKTEAKANTAAGENHADANKVTIDFDGIGRRIIAFPVAEGKYIQITGTKGKALFLSTSMRGSLESVDTASDGLLELYDFEQQKKETIATGVKEFQIAADAPVMLCRFGQRIRVISPAPITPDKQSDERPSKRSGWIDLSRIKISIIPTLEWKQMFRELWRLQRDHYWTAEMAGINWESIYRRYLPMLERIATRTEFSDLVLEVHGELGTSHAYEQGGDFRRTPNYRHGFLAADFRFDDTVGGYSIERIIHGDSWSEHANSALAQPGANISEGDILLEINGRRLSRNTTPDELLVNLAGQEVRLTLQSKDNAAPRHTTVKILSDETTARYRNWVENNKRIVHEATDGRIGYVHLPNMGPLGFAEFHRYYFREVEREGLIVDVRFNGGGHVSQLILEKLARKRIAYTVRRWGQPHSYPYCAVLGPIIALTNEYAGSDGDIFSHCFKLMNLGKLVGKRTWGGVVGISPRHRLVDGTVTTQPEFSFWFKDVGWSVENYGTDPDIEVEITPQNYRDGLDPQLKTCIEIISNELKVHPVSIPVFDKRPNLAYPQ